ncbi:MAG: PilZ domain-containing protein [Desulfatibacillum sp.]|nr:PilZ domain-containing protein [Desulfatibacillum sp.]
MTISEESEKRDYVRVPYRGNVTFRLLDEEEFQALRCERENWSSNQHCGLVSEKFEETKQSSESSVDPNLVRFLLHLEDKLDRILGLLDEKPRNGMEMGYGLDISSSGIKFLSHQAIEEGRHLEMRFVVSRYPVVSLDILGTVTRVIPVSTKGVKQYEVATDFYEFDEQSTEEIMAYAFRVQRESLRAKRKEQSSG